MNFTEDFKNILNGVQTLQNHLEVELNSINNRIGYLEEQQFKDNTFFQKLEVLIQERNNK